jgi:hypothetical protein
LRSLAQPGEVNFGGKMHGGALMRWIDRADYSTPMPTLNPTREVDPLWQRYAIKAMQLHTELTAQMQALRNSLQSLSRPDAVD